MSRSYKHINKDCSKNNYAKHIYFSWYYKNPYYYDVESISDSNQSFNALYHFDWYSSSAPKSFRKELNRSKKSKDKQEIIRRLKNNTFDDMPKFKWFNDANYLYW
jgi:hypothetical protein